MNIHHGNVNNHFADITKEELNTIISNASISAKLSVSPNFTGRVLVYVENGRVTSDAPLLDDEHVGRMGVFLELARRAGYTVLAPAQESDVNHAA
ncbi:hypothetical protein [Dickeya sp. ws52]|uniref:hypothetical protein n=1 Tax=Dickeya sp. ws52 TaxID=2576377 RepID=UPI00351BD780